MDKIKIFVGIIILILIIILAAIGLFNQSKLPEYKSEVKFDEGAQMNYKIYGDGKPVLFIHGLGTDSGIWEYQIEKLKNNYKVITVDLYGHGLSKKIPEEIGIKQTAAEIINIIVDNDISSVDIVAQGLGGLIALDMKNMKPAIVNKMILIDTAVQRRKVELMDDIYLKYIESNFDKAVEEYFADKIIDKEIMKRVKSKALSVNQYAFYNYTKSTIERDFIKISEKFNKNVYLIYSKAFVKNKKYLDSVKRQHGFKDVDKENMYYYPDSGFFIMIEKPENFLLDLGNILE